MSDLDQTIEELEAEVLAELEEADAKTAAVQDLGAPGGQKDAGKSVGKSSDPAPNVAGADKAEKVAGEVADGGKPVVKGDETSTPTDVATKKSKEVSGDAQQKGEGKADAPKKLAAGDEVDHDGEELSEAPKMTKAQHIEAIGKMKKADIEEMIAGFASKLKEAENTKTEEELKALEDAKAEIEEKIKNISVKEDVDALTEGEDLSEEFKEKAATVFEAALKSKMRSEVEKLSEAYKTEKDQEIETFKDELTEKVDNYLNYVVDEWTKENELAIERGLKGEIAEDFISGLKQLFEDHYIDVPDEKYDVLEAQSDKIAELEEKLNEEIQKNIEFKNSNNDLVREQVIAEVSNDLADTEFEKFKDLTRDVEFTEESSYRDKLNTLKENYFPRVQNSSDGTISYEEDGGTAKDVDTTDTMKKYMSAISRDQKASA